MNTGNHSRSVPPRPARLQRVSPDATPVRRALAIGALAALAALWVIAPAASANVPASAEASPGIGTVGVGVGAVEGSLWMTGALNARLLDEAAQLALRPGEAGEVAAVAALICDVHEGRPRCGSQCTSTRRDRRHIPDYSDFVVEPPVCWDVARVLVAAAHDYDVPLETLLAAAYQESRFRPLALGSGSECGLFQQTTHHIRYASTNVEHMGRVPHGDAIDVCTYLLRPENAAWHFALKYHHEVAQTGRNWAAYYNGGPDMWGYQDRHESYRARFERYLSAYQQANTVDFRLQ